MSSADTPWRTAAVLGRPIGHSLSPFLHRRWLVMTGAQGDYTALEVDEKAFDRFCAHAGRIGFVGANVTAPHKARALAAAHTAEPLARRLGAANLLGFARDGSIHARNTDVEGFSFALACHVGDLSPAEANVVILGAGGVVPAVLEALRQWGAHRVLVAARRPERAAALGQYRGSVEAAPLAQAAQLVSAADLLINALPAAAFQDEAVRTGLATLPATAHALDLSYRRQGPTAFQAALAQTGRKAPDGLAMLIGQARPSFEAFFDIPAPHDPGLAEALGREGL